MSGTTMSTPSNSASGNIRPASTTMMSSPQRTAMQFIPNSPSPPSGTICNFPVGIEKDDASTVEVLGTEYPVPSANVKSGSRQQEEHIGTPRRPSGSGERLPH